MIFNDSRMDARLTVMSSISFGTVVLIAAIMRAVLIICGVKMKNNCNLYNEEVITTDKQNKTKFIGYH
jgi:hypothetical protein